MEIRFNPLEQGCFYHVFNSDTNGCEVFINNDNYLFFLSKMKKYLLPVAAGDMKVVSGGFGREVIHFVAPKADRLANEMNKLIEWFNTAADIDPVLKAAIVHLWFVTIHPFDDGNGRLARALTDMQLSKADGVNQRFYSMSAQIRKERKAYYEIFEKTQKGDSDITNWIIWFLTCLKEAIISIVYPNLQTAT